MISDGALSPLLFVVQYISDDGTEGHNARMQHHSFPAHEVLQLGFQLQQTVLENEIVIFTFGLSQQRYPLLVCRSEIVLKNGWRGFYSAS